MKPTSMTSSAELRQALAPYSGAARKVASARRTPRKPMGNEAEEIRAWALSNGIQVNARGRTQADVLEKYRAAH